MADFNHVMSEVAAADPERVTTVEIDSEIVPRATDFRWDLVHYTHDGAVAVADILRPAVDAARNTPPSPAPILPRASCAPGAIP